MDNNNLEQWKPVVGYEGLYAVSSLGNVKSVERTVTSKDGRKRHYKEKLLKPTKNSDDYLKVNLSKNGVVKTCKVHRLVAEAFISNSCPEKYDIINHKIEGDEGKLINTVESLEWCDIPYNNTYGTANERRAKTLTNRSDLSKTVFQYDKDTHELVKEWESTMEIERQTGFNNGAISQCCNNRFNREGNNVYKGFIWSYE